MASLSDLSNDILITIALLLSYCDLVRLATLCKTFHRLAVYVVQLQRRRDIPWLMDIDRYTLHSNIFKSELLDFQFNQSFSLSKIIGSQVRELLYIGSVVASKYGWLLITESRFPTNPKYCFCSPLTNEIIQLPPIGSDDYFIGATFSSPPTSSDCVVFLICKRGLTKAKRNICSISTCNLRERRWTTYTSNVPPEAQIWEVAYVNGSFYCAFTDGSTVLLGTFNVALQDWTIVDYSSSIEIKPCDCVYLVDSDGELLLMVLRNHRFGRVYSVCHQFNRLRKDWTLIESLGNQVLFFSDKGSIVVPAVGVVSAFANMIVWLGMSNDLKSSTYKTEGGWKYHELKTWNTTTLPIWIEPLYILEKRSFLTG